MAQLADRVHSDAVETARLAALSARLDDEERVALTLVDGSRMSGVVVARPVLQTFLDADGNEGINAVLRLDDASDPARYRSIWLDEVLDVQRFAEGQARE